MNLMLRNYKRNNKHESYVEPEKLTQSLTLPTNQGLCESTSNSDSGCSLTLASWRGSVSLSWQSSTASNKLLMINN